MKIALTNISKRFNNEWIFRNINYEFESGNAYVILGANGSGKSTLLQVIAGSAMFSDGDIVYTNHDSQLISSDSIYQHLSLVAPYLDLFEEYTLKESIVFHAKQKSFFFDLSVDKIIEIAGLERSKDKQLKYFSSGMKQRVKLALAVLSDVPILLLDEPCSNLDQESIEWYKRLITNYSKNRLIIVCSNQQRDEYEFCNFELDISTFKKV